MQLATLTGNFTALDQIVQLDVPNLSKEAALRLHVHGGRPAQILLIMIADPAIVSTHARHFTLIAPDQDLPPNFVKYIGTIPFNGQSAHVIEVGVPLPISALSSDGESAA